MRTLAPLLLAAAPLAAAPLSAQLPPMLSRTHVPQEIVIDLYGGEGPMGGVDSRVSVLVGPTFGWPAPFTPADFAQAKAGPGAAVLDNAPFAINALTTHPEARWIAPDQASGAGANQVPGLFAVQFGVPDVPIFSAKLDLWFSVDESLGQGPNEGVFLNEEPVADTSLVFGAAGQNHFSERSVGHLIQPGRNTLYLYMNNTSFFGGLLFHARITINTPVPDECFQALPIKLGLTEGSTAGFGPSVEGASCGILGDRWYVFVPPASGTLNAELSDIGGNGYAPALGVFSGDCGALSQLGCTSGSAGTPATFSGAVTAGEPVFLAAGGANAVGGDFLLDLELIPHSSGNVYSGNGHLYVTTPGQVDVFQARAFAQQQGGYLTAINDPAENAFIAAQLGASSGVWIGLSDELVEGNYLWDSGEPFVAGNWNATEPNDHPLCGGEDYVEIVGGGKWNDLASGGALPCLCCAHVRIGLVEIPASGLASVLDLGGACAPESIPPQLYSEPHRIGQSADMAVLDAPPLQPVILFRSAPPLSPTPSGGCTVHLDLGAATVAFSGVASAHGAVSLSMLTPNDSALIGLAEHWQAQVIAGGATYYSNGLELKKGS